MLVSIRKRRLATDFFDEYLEDLEQEFEEWRGRMVERPSWNQRASTMEPLRDVVVTPTEVVVTVDLPFTKENTLRVRTPGENTVEVSAEMKRKITFREMGITHHKGEFQRFHCRFRLPVSVQMRGVKIRFKKGMLEVHLSRKFGRSKKKA
jgi:HSP20 family molecular chaperone IbpA